MENNSYISLHTHSDYSFQDSIAKVQDLVNKARSLNMPALAITDHGNICAWLKFNEYCTNKKYGKFVKPIFGMEAYITEDADLVNRINDKIEKLEMEATNYMPLFSFYDQSGEEKQKEEFDDLFGNVIDPNVKIEKLKQLKNDNRKSNHLIILAKNKKGYNNLIKLSSYGWLTGLYYKPRLDLKIIEKHKEGLIVLSACLGGQISSSILKGELQKAEEYVVEYKRIFGEDFYLEIQLHEIDEQKTVNKKIIELAEKYDVKLVITQDIHYVDKEDIELHEIIIKLKRNQKEVKEEDEPVEVKEETEKVSMEDDKEDSDSYFYKTRELYFKSLDELKESLNRNHSYITMETFNKAIQNTYDIAGKVESIQIRSEKPLIPMYDTGKLTPREFIFEKVKEGARLKLAEKLSKNPELKKIYEKRIKEELDTICELNFEPYFIIEWDMMRMCKENDIMTGCGRGSAAGSLLSFCLGITDIDPIEHDLLFSRFINKSRSGAKYKLEFDEYPQESKV